MVVFVDMDGVLVNFAAGVAKLFGLPLADVEANGGKVYELVGVTKEEFWQEIQSAPRWWEDLQPYPWVTRLVEACATVGDVYVATSPPRDCFTACSGKMKWLKQHLPEVYAGRRYFIGTHKWLLAGPDRVLVDDDASKCKAFSSAGGKAFLFPRPWNLSHNPPAATPEGLIEAIESGSRLRGRD